jgi:hypothetical protein
MRVRRGNDLPSLPFTRLRPRSALSDRMQRERAAADHPLKYMYNAGSYGGQKTHTRQA